MSLYAAPARFDMGRVLSRLFEVLGRNFGSFFGLSAVLVGIPSAIAGMAQTRLWVAPGAAMPVWLAGSGSLMLLGWLIGWIANAVLQGAVIHGAVSDLAGRRAGFGDSLAVGMRFLLPLIGLGIVVTIGVFIGFLLLVVPGVLLALAWTVGAPAAVMERRGVFGALSRSADLTRNHRGAIFGLALLYGIALMVFQSVAFGVVDGLGAVALGGSTSALPWLTTATSVVVQTFNALVISAGVASIYYELRFIKEGVGAEQLASVFE